jgi:hypothetical protein
MIGALKLAYQNKLAVDANEDKKTELCGGRKSRHCAFRLLNVLFCEEIVHQFARIGDTPSRQAIDAKKHKNNQAFWEMVESEFKSVSSNYSMLLFQDDHYITAKSTVINPADIRNHSWVKLRDIYQEMQGKYRTAHTNWKRSGNHNPDFMAYCKRLDIYYLWKHLQIHPEVLDFVIAKLPPGCAISSVYTHDSKPSSNPKLTLTDSGRKKRKQMEPINLTNCFKDITDSINKTGDVNAKTSLFFEEEGKLRKKEYTSNEKHRIFQARKSIWKEI